MKAKIIAGLLAIAVMVSGVMVGCEGTTGEVVYTEVSIGRMTVSIPDDWERPGEHAEIVEDFASYMVPELMPFIQLDAYVDQSEDVFLAPIVMDMKQLVELEGIPWEGWDIMLEAAYMTKEDYATMASVGFIGELEELSRKVHRQVTIHGNEAWESHFTGNMEGMATRANLLIIFGEDDMGILVMLVEQPKWGEFEAIWDEIRDSVELTPQG